MFGICFGFLFYSILRKVNKSGRLLGFDFEFVHLFSQQANVTIYYDEESQRTVPYPYNRKLKVCYNI